VTEPTKKKLNQQLAFIKRVDELMTKAKNLTDALYDIFRTMEENMTEASFFMRLSNETYAVYDSLKDYLEYKKKEEHE